MREDEARTESGEMTGPYRERGGAAMTFREQLVWTSLCIGPFNCHLSFLHKPEVVSRIPSMEEEFGGSERLSNIISLHSIKGCRDEISTKFCLMPKPCNS